MLHMPSQRKTKYNYTLTEEENTPNKKKKKTDKQSNNPITIQRECINASDERRRKIRETSKTIFIG